ncbi:paraplegin-like [Adelges cooleyi]|uniref:paraplegin-like n=1 Tax=Adelges cooleyi TaxID=133065 RepID=UPI00217FD703|nr:paraplegin-like [Adelges cooleyi]
MGFRLMNSISKCFRPKELIEPRFASTLSGFMRNLWLNRFGNKALLRKTRAKYAVTGRTLYRQGFPMEFKDVAGLHDAKLEMSNVLASFNRPLMRILYEYLGARVPKGALLSGPTGCGKTLLAKAAQKECQVPFFFISGPEFVGVSVGVGASRVRQIFKHVRQYSPCIVYIDEIDAIGRQRRGLGGDDEGERTLNQLLVEMDGIGSKEGVLLLASTSKVDTLDSALLRSGRFDHHIVVELPTLQERKEIFEQHLTIRLSKIPQSYSQTMAQLTPGFSGAEIANVCKEAALHAARNNRKLVVENDLYYAVERMIGGAEKRSNSISAEEKQMVAYHQAGRALVGWLWPTINSRQRLHKISIVPRTHGALGFAQYIYIQRERNILSKQALLEKMCMKLGGRAAESIVFNSCTTTSKNEFREVTKIANAMVRQFGMNDNVGLLSFPKKRYNAIRPLYSKKLAALMEIEVSKLVAEAYFKTERLLKENRDKLELVAEELLRKETLNYAEIEKLIGPPPNSCKIVT